VNKKMARTGEKLGEREKQGACLGSFFVA